MRMRRRMTMRVRTYPFWRKRSSHACRAVHTWPGVPSLASGDLVCGGILSDIDTTSSGACILNAWGKVAGSMAQAYAPTTVPLRGAFRTRQPVL